MSDDIKAGDILVRIRIVARPANKLLGPLRASPVGKMVRCEAVVGPIVGEYGVVIEGYPSNHPTRAWNIRMYRKVPPASEEFAARIRACRPVKTKQPA